MVRLFPTDSLTLPEGSSRIQRGARVASLLRDPHAVQVLDCNANGEVPAFVVMERVLGRSLAEVMEMEGKLPLPRVVELVESLAVALAASHAMGLVHGDIRPDHVILPAASRPAAKLAGFGWAKELRAATRSPSPSRYLAPEQLDGTVLTLDERVDQFALATLTYHMVGGCVPFPDKKGVDLGDDSAAGPPTPPALSELVPGIPRALDEVLRRALSFAPSERFPGVLDLAARLRAVAESQAESSPDSVSSDGLADGPAAEPGSRVGAGRASPGALDREGSKGPSRGLGLGIDLADDLDPVTLSPDRDRERELLEAKTGEDAGAARLDRDRALGDDIEPHLVLEVPTRATGSILESQEEGSPIAPGAAAVEPPEDDVLILGPSTAATPSDDAKTQLVRSPFFEVADDPATDDAWNPRAADEAPGTRRRGIPTGRPPITTSWSGGLPVGPAAAGSQRSQRTNPGLGPRFPASTVLSPTVPSSPLDDPTADWPETPRRHPLVFPAVTGLGVLLIVGAMIWISHRASPARRAPPREDLAISLPAAQAPTSPPPLPGPPASIAATAAPVPATSQATKADSPPEPGAEAVSPAQRSKASPGAGESESPPKRVHAARSVTASRPSSISSSSSTAASASKSSASSATGSNPGTSKRAATPGAAEGCSVRISSQPWAEVWLDGKNTGLKTPIESLKVSCGAHKLELKRPDKDILQMEMLKVAPGKPYRGSYELE